VDKVSKVSFKGIENAGGIQRVFKKPSGDIKKLRLVVRLTNDENSKYLDEFKLLLTKFPDYLNKGYLRIDYVAKDEFKESNRISKSPIYDKINGSFDINEKHLKIKDKNISFIKKLNDLLNKVKIKAEINEELQEPVKISDDYTKEELLENYMIDKNMFSEPALSKIAKIIHSNEIVNKVSGILEEIVQKKMAKYFNKPKTT
jgi:hypothetical protein